MDRAHFLAGAVAAALSPPAQHRSAFDRRLLGAIDAIPGIVGVYARTMAPGPPLFARNANHSFPSASTIKTVIMLTAFRLAERDPGVMHRRITFRRSELIGGSDFLAGAGDGERFTVLQLLVPMIQVSDNTASNLLITHFGFERINQVARQAGLHHTQLKRHFLDFSAIVHHMDNRTTPADMAHLLFEIERGAREGIATVATPQSCRRMIEIMLGQTDRDKIPAGLPRGVSVANKTGEVDGVRNDMAIVDPFGDSPYVLTVFTKRLAGYADAYAGIARISRIVYARVAGSGL